MTPPDCAMSPRRYMCERCGGTGEINEDCPMYDSDLGRSRDYAKGERCDVCEGVGFLGMIETGTGA